MFEPYLIGSTRWVSETSIERFFDLPFAFSLFENIQSRQTRTAHGAKRTHPLEGDHQHEGFGRLPRERGKGHRLQEASSDGQPPRPDPRGRLFSGLSLLAALGHRLSRTSGGKGCARRLHSGMFLSPPPLPPRRSDLPPREARFLRTLSQPHEPPDRLHLLDGPQRNRRRGHGGIQPRLPRLAQGHRKPSEDAPNRQRQQGGGRPLSLRRREGPNRLRRGPLAFDSRRIQGGHPSRLPEDQRIHPREGREAKGDALEGRFER